MKKRVISVLLGAVLLMSLAACGGKSENEDKMETNEEVKEETKEEEAENTTEEKATKISILNH